MNWKVGDTAVSLFNIFQTNRNYPDLGTELKVKAGEIFEVLEVTEIENHLVLDIGLTKRIKILEYHIICDDCKTHHALLVTDPYSNKIYLLATWFKKIEPNQAKEKVETAQIKTSKDVQILESNPFLPTEPIEIKQKPEIKKEEIHY